MSSIIFVPLGMFFFHEVSDQIVIFVIFMEIAWNVKENDSI